EVDPAAAEAFILEGRGRAAAGRPGASPDVPATAPTPTPRAPQGSKVMITRKSGVRRWRMTVYLNPATAQQLKDHCEAHDNVEQSLVVEKALRAFFEQAGRS
ncbi:MAG: hypothetical protein Q8M76_08435, partial [Spirochaetaceae bacterium]|nr:hypothetical protein [Spirochaetaceae bacterium]